MSFSEGAGADFDIRDIHRQPRGGQLPNRAEQGLPLVQAVPARERRAAPHFDVRNFVQQRCDVKIAGGCCCASFVIVIVLIFMSVGSLSPTEYGLCYNKFSKSVQGNDIYHGGRHLIGPFSELKKFPATAQIVEFSLRDGATAEPLSTRTQEGLALVLSVSFQYQLIKSEVSSLYSLANTFYEALFVKVARDILLKAAARYTAPQYWEERIKISNEIEKLVGDALLPSHAVCLGLQLLVIELPDKYEDSIVATQVQKQGVKTRENEQRAAVIRAKIQAMVADYQNNITVTINKANAEATFTTKSAEAVAAQRTIDAESRALDEVTKNLGFTPAAQVDYQKTFAYQSIKNASFLFGVKNAVTVLGAAATGASGPSTETSCQSSGCGVSKA